MKILDKKLKNLSIYKDINTFCSDSNIGPRTIEDLVEEKIDCLKEQRTSILDLGCGRGASKEKISQISDDIKWTGIDVDSSPEMKKSKAAYLFDKFDGVNLPYAPESYDIIFCRQVLEHVEKPYELIRDSHRVLKRNGYFIGSVSYLEPFHSKSLFNFTPLGIKKVFENAGYELQVIYPETDFVKCVLRQVLNKSKRLKIIWNINYFYFLTRLFGRMFGLDKQKINFLQIQYSGHLVFLARKK